MREGLQRSDLTTAWRNHSAPATSTTTLLLIVWPGATQSTKLLASSKRTEETHSKTGDRGGRPAPPPPPPPDNAFPCRHCSWPCLSRIGLVSHERACSPRKRGQTSWIFVREANPWWRRETVSVWLHSSVGRASHRYRGDHGFESRWNPDFFFRLLLSNYLNWKINCDDHFSLSPTAAVQIWMIPCILYINKLNIMQYWRILAWDSQNELNFVKKALSGILLPNKILNQWESVEVVRGLPLDFCWPSPSICVSLCLNRPPQNERHRREASRRVLLPKKTVIQWEPVEVGNKRQGFPLGFC